MATTLRQLLFAHLASSVFVLTTSGVAHATPEVASPAVAGKAQKTVNDIYSSGLDAEKIQEEFLEAEAMSGYPAIFRWRELFQQDATALMVLPRGKDGIRTRLISALLEAIPTESNPQRQQDWLDEVELLASLTSDPMQRAWANILLLKQLSPSDRARVEKTVRLARTAIEQIKDAYVRSYASAAFAEVLLTAPSSGALEADFIIDKTQSMLSHQIVTARQRARVVRLFAYKQITLDSRYASLMQGTDPAELARQLLLLGSQALASGDYTLASRLVLASHPEREEERTNLLKEIAKKQIKNDALQDAFATIWGIVSDKTQNQQLKKIALDLLDEDEVPSAEIVAAQVDDGVVAVMLWTKVSEAYRVKGYITRMKQVHGHAWESASRITRPARRAEAFAILAEALSKQGSVERVPLALQEARTNKRYRLGLSAYAVELSRQGKLEQAQKVMDGWVDEAVSFAGEEDSEDDKELSKMTPVARDVAWASLAQAYARSGNDKEALNILQNAMKDAVVSGYDEALLELVKYYAKKAQIADAEDAIGRMHTPSKQAVAYAELAVKIFKTDVGNTSKLERFTGLASRTVIKEATAEIRDDALVVMAGRYLNVGMVTYAQALFGAATTTEAKAGLHTEMARYFASQGLVKDAQGQAEKVEDDALRDKAYAAVSDALVRANHVRDAVAIIRKMKGDIPRVQAFHSAARTQAYRTDFYGLMKGMTGNTTPPEQLASPGNLMPSPLDLPNNPLSAEANKAFEDGIIDESRKSSDDVLLKQPLPSVIGRSVPAFDEKALQVNESRATLAARIPANTDFLVSAVSYEHSTYQQKFYMAMGASGFLDRQKQFAPDMLVLERGVADISGLYLALRAQGLGDDYLSKNGRVYTLRKPLLVSPEASLVISGADVKELRLSSDRGAYLINAGNLYVQDTRVAGWNEASNKEDYAGASDKYRFRPFITSWSRSHTFMGGSVFTALGYADAKAYGVSITSGPKDVVQFKPDSIAAPDGVIAENSFRNMYYGFYSYEAERVALVGNEYKDNIIYGIDPHDRSRFLTIAFNTAWGAMKKHGIIISREVNDTTIIGNLTFENHGSGLMIDRLSVGTMMYGNTSFDNLQDGITIFESDCKVIASNRLFSNKRNGLKVRNARDVGVFYNVIHDNKQAAIEGYIANLRQDPAHKTRDFGLDPYSDINAMTVVGNWVERNGAGISALDMVALYLRGNYFVQQSPHLWKGTWQGILADITTRFDLQTQGVLVTTRCPTGELLEHRKRCRFRTEGFFNGDGQDLLEDRIGKKLCGVGS